MRAVVNIAEKQTAEIIRAGFIATGQARADLDDLTITAAQWRALARSVARELGRPVQTIGGEHQVIAVLKDWPSNDEERAISAAALRWTVDAVSKLFDPDPDPVFPNPVLPRVTSGVSRPVRRLPRPEESPHTSDR